jgi:ADP-ribose pyrophosphatase
LADIPLCIGYSNEILHYYLATDLTLGERELDEGEFLDVFTVPLKEALAMSLDGRITDAKTIVALHLAQGHLAQAHLSKP